jgi:uncharacterized protein YbaR (Trm112 family)
MLDVLACTECKSPLKLADETIDEKSGDNIIDAVLVCTECARRYSVIYGVPDMLPK